MVSPIRKVEDIVVEFVLLIPEADSGFADVVHCFSHVQEVLEELGRDVLIDRISSGKFEGDAHEIQAIHGHPTGAVRLIDKSAGRQGSAAVKYADIIQAKKSSLEDVAALRVLAIHPPGEVQHQFVEDALEEIEGPRGWYRRLHSGARDPSGRRARSPKRGREDSHRRKPTRRREAGHWDAYTIPAS